MVLISALFLLMRSLIAHRTALAAENLALRQQLALLNRKIHRPQLHRRRRDIEPSIRRRDQRRIIRESVLYSQDGIFSTDRSKNLVIRRYSAIAPCETK